MKVLSVGYPLAPVGRDSTGGAEQVLSMLDHALVRAGHRSIVIACDGSEIAGEWIRIPLPSGSFDEEARRRSHHLVRTAIERTLAREEVDVIHLHGVDFDQYLPGGEVPVLVTLHLPLRWYPTEALRAERPNTHLHCVSESQQATAPPGLRFLPPIENGVDLDRLRGKRAKRGWLLSLGRICPEKGFHLAIEAARAAGAPFLLAGAVHPYPEHEAYFDQEVRPRLDRLRRYIGPIGFARKRRLLCAARALLAPSLVPETSSLAAMEALCCGTPVIAFPSGALARIIEHGRTGFLVENESEMAAAIEQAGAIDPEQCRQAAVERFSAERTAREYFERYRMLADKEPMEAHAAPSRPDPHEC